MEFKQLIDTITPETYETLQRALELGKWANGVPLTPPQKAQVMQALIAYGELYLEADQRVGFIDRGHKVEGAQCDDSPIRFLQ